MLCMCIYTYFVIIYPIILSCDFERSSSPVSSPNIPPARFGKKEVYVYCVDVAASRRYTSESSEILIKIYCQRHSFEQVYDKEIEIFFV
jgi:hypothetical protein